ncbi:MAG TPA: ester cyclase, partial [Pyrinomonadaceae bacterium]|nr:ester cyclase [Pyrinomonadaceae bacterium]
GELLHALPDLKIQVKGRHVAADSVIVEVTITGTHLGPWRGLPATGRKVEFPLCGIFEFDADDRLAAERIYYDRGAVLGQLGLFHEPMRGLGRVATAVSHPVTIARAYLRRSPQ